MIRKHRCKKCLHEFFLNIAVTSILESRRYVKVKCHRCKSKDVDRLITDVALVVYRGSGFYTTDKDNKND